jgi:hypothetical protein
MQDDLYRLLGLTTDTDPAYLRVAYEGAVAAATNRHDWARATQLSAAFDQLPHDVRLAIFPGRERTASRWQHPANDSRPAGNKAGRSGRPVRWRMVFSTVGAITLLGLAGLGLLHRLTNTHNPTQTPAGLGLTQPVPATTTRPTTSLSGQPRLATNPTATPSRTTHSAAPQAVPPLGNTGRQIGGLPLWTTPPGITLDSTGHATARCAKRAAVRGPAAGPWFNIDHRQAFTCPAGYMPEFQS